MLDATQKLHFYQKGTFTVGNRLVSDQKRAVTAGESIGAVYRSLYRALVFRNQAVADGEGALLIEVQLLDLSLIHI